MTTVDFEPLSVTVPLSEDPPGVFRVGKTRVLLELVLRAFKRGESAEAIVRSYRDLQLPDVYAVISRYLASSMIIYANAMQTPTLCADRLRRRSRREFRKMNCSRAQGREGRSRDLVSRRSGFQ